ncbi:MAG: hypothetical protein ACYC4U_11155 [Pirellulaceae bacterium]
MQVSAVGIPWYRSADDYAQLRAVSGDADTFCDTYDEWLTKAQQLENRVTRDGGRPIRAYMDPVEFPKWCRDRGLNINTQARSHFGSEFAAQVIFKERSV